MPYLKDPRVERLVLPSDPSYWVEMKAKVSYGDKAAAQNAMMRVSTVDTTRLNGEKRGQVVAVDQSTGMGALTEYETAAYMGTLIARLIVDWNIDGLNGKLPITRESVELLDDDDGQFLQREAQKRMGGRPKDQADPSMTLSSPSSPVAAATRRTRRPRAS